MGGGLLGVMYKVEMGERGNGVEGGVVWGKGRGGGVDDASAVGIGM